MREVSGALALLQMADQPGPASTHGGNPLKRVIAIAALLLGVAAAFSIPASADTACIEIHLNVNGTPVDQVQCV